MMRYIIFYSILFCFGCNSSDHAVNHAFYYWKTKFEISKTQSNYLDAISVRKLYVKFFDVDFLENKPVPLAEINATNYLDTTYDIVPVIFITNRTFISMTRDDMLSLADSVFEKLEYIAKEKMHTDIKTVQIDCDWTEHSKEKYFLFLKELKSRMETPGWSLSATIRFHQVKYFQRTGIPPVDRGMLMWYNTGDLEDINETNSILNDQKTAAYLTGLKSYPLPLDYVLPLFSWCNVFRDGQLALLIHPFYPEAMHDTTFFHQTTANRYEVLKNGYFQGHYLYQGDFIRSETVSQRQLKTASEQIAENAPFPNYDIAFFYLDSLYMLQYPADFIRQL